MILNQKKAPAWTHSRKYVPDIQDALPLRRKPASMQGKSTPMEVMDTPSRAGDLRHGYQAGGGQSAK